MNRSAITAALLALVQATTGIKNSGLILKAWNDQALGGMPAMFLVSGKDTYVRQPNNLPPIVTRNYRVIIYQSAPENAAPGSTPGQTLNDIMLDALDTAFLPAPGSEVNTLGNLVNKAWAEGDAETDNGDIDGAAMIVYPIKVLVPN